MTAKGDVLVGLCVGEQAGVGVRVELARRWEAVPIAHVVFPCVGVFAEVVHEDRFGYDGPAVEGPVVAGSDHLRDGSDKIELRRGGIVARADGVDEVPCGSKVFGCLLDLVQSKPVEHGSVIGVDGHG